MSEAFTTYIRALGRKYHSGDATEHTHRPAFQTLLESLGWTIDVVNEPKRSTECGAPDFAIKKSGVPIGNIETKDIGKNLDRQEKTEQLVRYLDGLNNLILTDYLEFRWYKNGEHQMTARLARINAKGRIEASPDGMEDVATLIGLFLDAEVETIGTARDLARRLAGMAQIIKETIRRALEQERVDAAARGTAPSPHSFNEQLKGFREVLIHDLSEDDFADMYAQTICYGLFAARFNKKPGEEFTREAATFRLSATNPFLARTFARIGGADTDERLEWAVDNLAEILNRTAIEEIEREFRGPTRRDDPVVHFYESFLAEYNPALRDERGVYYTPGAVVSFIVRSIDRILRRDFGLEHGLKDESMIDVAGPDGQSHQVHKLQILDPAAGTGTFLHGVFDHIYHEHFTGIEGLWPSYVREHLLPRVHGFEFLMAPYAIAHLKLNIKLKDTYCELHGGERLNIFLTNTLEEPHILDEPPVFSQWLSEEANAAGSVKEHTPVMVVLGNPPYEGNSKNPSERDTKVNKGNQYFVYDADRTAPRGRKAKKNLIVKERTYIGHLLHGWDMIAGKACESYFEVDGGPLGERNPKAIQNDYVKFIRFAQHRIARTGYGVVGYITDHNYLTSPPLRGMRAALMSTFDDIYILNLNGNTRSRQRAPDGGADENVFEIQQGVAIALLVKRNAESSPACTVRYADVWGRNKLVERSGTGEIRLVGGKYFWLGANDVETVDWTEIQPSSPDYRFAPRGGLSEAEIAATLPIQAIFPVANNGFKSHRDKLAVALTSYEMRRRVTDFANLDIPDEDVSERFGVKNSADWSLHDARLAVSRMDDPHSDVVRCLFQPFDYRYTHYSREFMDRPRTGTGHHARHPNLCLAVGRQGQVVGGDEWNLVTAGNCVANTNLFRRGGIQYFPLYLYPEPTGQELGIEEWPAGRGGRRPNLDRRAVERLTGALGMAFTTEGRGDLEANIGPEDIFHYIYAILHAPSYRERYADHLQSDYPRIPLTEDRDLFRELCRFGARLVALHLMEEAGGNLPGFRVPGENLVGKPRYTAPTGETPGRVWLNKEQYFEGVRPEVWEFRVGGFQVLEKWLKDRREQTLNHGDLEHYRQVVATLAETIEIMDAMDAAIDAHGGWLLHSEAGAP